MSLHELEEEKERQEQLAEEAEAEVHLAVMEITAAKARLNAAQMKHKEATSTMKILDDKIAEMEDARDRGVGVGRKGGVDVFKELKRMGPPRSNTFNKYQRRHSCCLQQNCFQTKLRDLGASGHGLVQGG